MTEPTQVATVTPPSVKPLPMIEFPEESDVAVVEPAPFSDMKVKETPAQAAADAESSVEEAAKELATELPPEPQMIPSFGPQIFAKSNHASASDANDVVEEASEQTPPVAKASEILGGQIPETLLLPAKPSTVEGDNRLAAAVEAAKAATQIDAPMAFADDKDESAGPAEPTAPSAADVAKANEQVKVGVACEAVGNTVDALAAYQMALQLNPTDAQIYCRRGHLLLDELRTAEALADFEQAVKLAPGLANGYFGRAHVRFQTENFAEAIGDYDVALRLDDQHAQALFERGYCKFKLGDVEKARLDRRAAIDLDPTLAKAEPKYAVDTSRQLAQSKLDGATAFAGDDDEPTPTAIATDEATTATSTNAVSISVDDVPAAAFDSLFGGATQLNVGGQTTQTLQAQATVVEMACNLPAEEQVKLNAEIEQLSTDLLTMPGDRDRYFRRARAYCLLGRPVDALDDLNTALRFDSKMPEALKLRAEVHRQLNRRDAAQADFNRLIELNPSDPSAFVLRAEYSVEIGQFDAALADLNRAVELNPGDPATFEERSRLHAERGNFDQSHADHQRAVELGSKAE